MRATRQTSKTLVDRSRRDGGIHDIDASAKSRNGFFMETMNIQHRLLDQVLDEDNRRQF